MRFDLVVNDKKQGLLVVKRRAEYDDVGYFSNVIEVGISLIEMQSGMVLDLGAVSYTHLTLPTILRV